MRFAAIADIHGNHLALQAVLADIRAQGIDQIVNLGDSFSGPLEAGLTADLLMPLNALTVRGNHDRALVDRPLEAMGDWEKPSYPQLSATHLDWIRRLPETERMGDEVFLCHATPQDDNTYWTETLSPDGIFHLKPLAEIEALAEGIDMPLLLCGHSHIPRAVQLSDGRLIPVASAAPASIMTCPSITRPRPERRLPAMRSSKRARVAGSRVSGWCAMTIMPWQSWRAAMA